MMEIRSHNDAVLVLPKNARYHTSLHCVQIYDRTRKAADRVNEVTVQTRAMARRSGLDECKSEECRYFPWYFPENGWELANERD